MKALPALAAAGGAYLAVRYINPYSGAITLSELVLQLSGSRGDLPLGFSASELLEFAMRLLPMFLFELYAGIALYRHFCTASIYVFSRYPHRVRWYFGEIVRLGAAALLFQSLCLATAVLVTGLRCELKIDRAGLVLAAFHFLLYALWTYAMTLAVNLLALCSDSNTAYTIVAGTQLSCIALFALARQPSARMLRINPLARLVLGWHDVRSLSVTEALLVILCALVSIAGAFLIKNHDLLSSDSETEAA